MLAPPATPSAAGVHHVKRVSSAPALSTPVAPVTGSTQDALAASEKTNSSRRILPPMPPRVNAKPTGNPFFSDAILDNGGAGSHDNSRNSENTAAVDAHGREMANSSEDPTTLDNSAAGQSSFCFSLYSTLNSQGSTKVFREIPPLCFVAQPQQQQQQPPVANTAHAVQPVAAPSLSPSQGGDGDGDTTSYGPDDNYSLFSTLRSLRSQKEFAPIAGARTANTSVAPSAASASQAPPSVSPVAMVEVVVTSRSKEGAAPPRQVRPQSRVPTVLTMFATQEEQLAAQKDFLQAEATVSSVTSTQPAGRVSRATPRQSLKKKRPASRAEYFDDLDGSHGPSTESATGGSKAGRESLPQANQAAKPKHPLHDPPPQRPSVDMTKAAAHPLLQSVPFSEYSMDLGSIDLGKEPQLMNFMTAPTTASIDSTDVFGYGFFGSQDDFKTSAKRPAYSGPPTAVVELRKPEATSQGAVVSQAGDPAKAAHSAFNGAGAPLPAAVAFLKDSVSADFNTPLSADAFFELPPALRVDAAPSKVKKDDAGTKRATQPPPQSSDAVVPPPPPPPAPAVADAGVAPAASHRPQHSHTPLQPVKAAAVMPEAQKQRSPAQGRHQQGTPSAPSSQSAGTTPVTNLSGTSSKSSSQKEFFAFLKTPNVAANATVPGGQSPRSADSNSSTRSRRSHLIKTNSASRPAMPGMYSLKPGRTPTEIDLFGQTTSTVTLSRPPSQRRRKRRMGARRPPTSVDGDSSANSSANSSAASTPKSNGSKRSGRGFNMLPAPPKGFYEPSPHGTVAVTSAGKAPGTGTSRYSIDMHTSDDDDDGVISYVKVRAPHPPKSHKTKPVKAIQPPVSATAHLELSPHREPQLPSQPQPPAAAPTREATAAAPSLQLQQQANHYSEHSPRLDSSYSDDDTAGTNGSAGTDTAALRMAPFLPTLQTVLREGAQHGHQETKSEMLAAIRALADDADNHGTRKDEHKVAGPTTPKKSPSAPATKSPRSAAAATATAITTVNGTPVPQLQLDGATLSTARGSERSPKAAAKEAESKAVPVLTVVFPFVTALPEADKEPEPFVPISRHSSAGSVDSALSYTGGFSVDSKGSFRRRRRRGRVVSFAKDTVGDESDEDL